MAARIHVSLDKGGHFFILRFYRVMGGTWWQDHHPGSWVNELPDFKRLDGGDIRAACCDTTIEKITARPNTELHFDDDSLTVWEYWKAVAAVSSIAASNIAAFKSEGKITPQPGIDYGALSPYQQVALNNIISLPSYALFMKQGTGKTPIAIMAIVNEARRRKQQKFRGLVVCPPNVRLNWQREFKKFAGDEVHTQVIRGGQVTRMSQIIESLQDPSPVGVMICNYETLQQSWDALSLIRFDYAVLDEAHYIKSHKTKRNHYAQLLGQNSSKRLILTGTPIANNVNDMWTLFEFMGPGTSGFRTFDGFKRFFGRYRQTDYGDAFEAAQNLPILKDRIARYSYVVTKEEALPHLPEKMYDAIEVEMTPEQADAYETLRDELVIEMEATLENAENEAIAVNNILTQLLRLSQITSSFKVIPAVIDQNGDVISPRRVIPFERNIKVEAVIELLPEKGPNDKTIIWSNWVEDIKAMEAALIAAGEQPVSFYGGTSYDDRQEAERKFNHDPACRWFIGNPAAGGTGLNLLGYPPDDPSIPTNCTHTIYMSQNWSSIHREQSEDRGHRRGTRVPVRISEIIVPGTIDSTIAERVMKKRLDAMSTLDVRQILLDIKSALGSI